MTVQTPVKPDPLASFMPWIEEDERQLRRRVLRCQQMSSSSARNATSDRARTIYWIACDIAAETAFAPATTDHLKDILATLARMFMAAGSIEGWSNNHGR